MMYKVKLLAFAEKTNHTEQESVIILAGKYVRETGERRQFFFFFFLITELCEGTVHLFYFSKIKSIA